MRLSFNQLLQKLGITEARQGYEKKIPNPRPRKQGSPVGNPKVAAQIKSMHEKWEKEQFPSRVTKQEPNPYSITSIRKATQCSKKEAHQARGIWAAENGVGVGT